MVSIVEKQNTMEKFNFSFTEEQIELACQKVTLKITPPYFCIEAPRGIYTDLGAAVIDALRFYYVRLDTTGLEGDDDEQDDDEGLQL